MGLGRGLAHDRFRRNLYELYLIELLSLLLDLTRHICLMTGLVLVQVLIHARQNLAATFVNAFVNAGFGQVKAWLICLRNFACNYFRVRFT